MLLLVVMMAAATVGYDGTDTLPIDFDKRRRFELSNMIHIRLVLTEPLFYRCHDERPADQPRMEVILQ